jgi:outer membrane lipoprotein-sorting protein
VATRLATIDTMEGEFIQFNPDGQQLQGKFYIARPGRVRFQYDPPSTVSVIADGKSVLVFDKKLQTYDIWPLSQTPLRLLLDKSLDLATSEKVTRVGVAPDLIEIELHDETRFSAGTLNLIFDRSNLDLRQWTVTDQQGLQTMVALYNVETGVQLASDLFKIDYNAATNAARENQNR